METPKKPWNFCETPEEKCTMNYCDENGCQSRKRNLVEPKKSKAATFILGQIDKAIEKSTLEQQLEKTETLYRKVAVSDDKKIIGGASNVIGHLNDLIHKLAYGGNDDLQEIAFKNAKDFFDILSKDFQPEIPDTTAQLKADKAELLEMLQKVLDHDHTFAEIESLIQKHKK